MLISNAFFLPLTDILVKGKWTRAEDVIGACDE